MSLLRTFKPKKAATHVHETTTPTLGASAPRRQPFSVQRQPSFPLPLGILIVADHVHGVINVNDLTEFHC
jgi:hypothetical protein